MKYEHNICRAGRENCADKTLNMDPRKRDAIQYDYCPGHISFLSASKYGVLQSIRCCNKIVYS